MKPSISRTKARKALKELKAALIHSNDVRPCAAIEPEEFFEMCEIFRTIKEQVEKLEKLVEGGAA